MTQLSCDTPGAVPKSAVYIGESPSPIAAQAVMERSLLPCLVQASSRRPWPLPYQDWRIARTDCASCFPAACVTNIGTRNPIWTQMHIRGLLSSLDGLIPTSKGCYCISKRLNCTRNGATTASVAVRNVAQYGHFCLTAAEVPVHLLWCGCVPCIGRKVKQGQRHAKVINSESLFFFRCISFV